MELRQLEIFRVLAAELNFTRAAARLNCVQSNVTVRIRALEHELGVPLFERLGKQVRITGHGRRLLPYAQQVLRLLDEAKAAVSSNGKPAGVLAVGTPESVLSYRLPKVLQAFRRRYPDVQLSFLPLTTAELVRQLESGLLDLTFLIDDPISNPRLEVEILRPEPLCLLAHPDHPLARLREVTSLDLQSVTLLLTETGCSYRRKLENVLAQAGVRPASVIEFATIEAIKQCAALGLGVALLPAVTAAREIAHRGLIELRWSGPDLTMWTLVAWHKDKWISPAMAAFLAIVRAQLAPAKRALTARR